MTQRLTLLSVLLFFFIEAFGQHEILVPYRSGNVWGLADTNVNIIVKPQYDSVISKYYDPNGYYTVMNDGKYGVITSKEVIIPPRLSSVSYRYGFIADIFYTTEPNERAYALYYNTKGEQVLSDTVRFLTPYRNYVAFNLYSIVHPDNSRSIVLYDKKEQKFTTWVFRKKFYDYVHSNTFEENLIIYCENNGIIESIFSVTKDSTGNIVSAELNEEDRKKYTGEVDEELDYEMVEEMPDEEVDEDWSKVSQEIEFNIEGEAYFIVSKRISTRRNSWRAESSPKNDTLSHGKLPSKKIQINQYNTYVDSATNDYYYDKGVRRYRGGKVRSTSYVSFTKKKKIGLITETAVIPAVYDTVYGIAAQSGNYPCFVVGQKTSKKGPMRYGVISFNGDTIIPVVHAGIEPFMNFGRNHYVVYTNGFITTNQMNKQSYIKRNGKLELSSYDSIIPSYELTNGLIVVENGLYGFYNNRFLIEPLYEYIPFNYNYFSQYKVLDLYDRSFNFKGYGKLNGDLFFKD